MSTQWAHTVVAGDPITALEVIEVRNAIDSAYVAAFGSAYTWTNQQPSAEQPIVAIDFTEMRTAIAALWSNAETDMGDLPNWGSPGTSAPAPGRPIYAQDLLDLRYWLNVYEDTGAQEIQEVVANRYLPSRHGVDSKAVAPLYGRLADQVLFNGPPDTPPPPDDQITDEWAQDVANLGVKWVRIAITSRQATDSVDPDLVAIYRNVCLLYRSRGVNVLGVLVPDLLRTARGNPDSSSGSWWPLEGTDLGNDYLREFARRAAVVAKGLRGVVDTFEVWNEPNDGGKDSYLPSTHFGSLLALCARSMTKDLLDPESDSEAPNPSAKIISGGLFFAPWQFDPPSNGAWDRVYMLGGTYAPVPPATTGDSEEGLYKSVAVKAYYDDYGAYPWDALGVHPYLNAPDIGPSLQAAHDVGQLTRDPDDPTIGPIDDRPIWATEFGVERRCADGTCVSYDQGSGTQQASEINPLFDAILQKDFVSTAFWHKHERLTRFPDSPGERFGLTEFEADPSNVVTMPDQRKVLPWTIPCVRAASLHWPAWSVLQARVRGSSAPCG